MHRRGAIGIAVVADDQQSFGLSLVDQIHGADFTEMRDGEMRHRGQRPFDIERRQEPCRIRQERGAAKQPFTFGDVTKAPDSAHRLAVDQLRQRMPLEHAAVLESKDVEGLLFGRRVQIADRLEESFRVIELIRNEGQQRGIVAALPQRRWYTPQRQKSLVAGGDVALPIDDQDSIGRGIERGLEERDRSVKLLGRLALAGDVHRSTHTTDDGAGVGEQRLDEYFEPSAVTVILERLAAAGQRGEMVGDRRLAGIVAADEVIDGRPDEPPRLGLVEHCRSSLHMGQPQITVGRPDRAGRLPENEAQVFAGPVLRAVRRHAASQPARETTPKATRPENCQSSPQQVSFRVVKDHPHGVAVAGSKPADTVAHVDPIAPARPPDRTVAHRPDDTIATIERDDLDARLDARTLFDEHELSPGEVVMRR
jgi:hypothetical protein